MGSAVTRLNNELEKFKDSKFLYTDEEKDELSAGIMNQRIGAEFAAAYMFYGTPISSKRASTDPISPLWIEIDSAVADAKNTEVEDDKLQYSVPSTVMILATGEIKVLFRLSSVQYDFTVRDIEAAMNPHTVVLPAPEPPFSSEALPFSLILRWSLTFPGGVTQRVELQYSTVKQVARYTMVNNTSRASPMEVEKITYQWNALTSKTWENPGLQSHLFDGLAPGHGFVFRLRYWVPRGWSEWSPPSPVIYTLPTAPECPKSPMLGALLPDAVQLCWFRPRDNGDTITSFVLRGKGIGYKDDEEGKDEVYTELYRGPRLHHLALHLQPDAAYSFQVAAMNSIGLSAFSPPLSVHTPSRSSKLKLNSAQNALECAQAWREYWDPTTQTVFYFNIITNTRQSERPAALIAAERQVALSSLQGPVVTGSDDLESEEEKQERIFRLKRFRFLKSVLGQRQDLRPVTPPQPVGYASRIDGAGSAASQEPGVTVGSSSSGDVGSGVGPSGKGQFILTVRRNTLLWDVYSGLTAATTKQLRGDVDGSNRRRRTRVQFVGEAGIDAGGLAKELFLLASRDLTSLGLKQGWLATGAAGTVYFRAVPAGTSRCSRDTKRGRGSGGDIESLSAEQLCSFFGRLCGLAVLDRQMISFPASTCILQQMLTGEGSATLKQLGDIDPSLEQSLRWMLKADVDITGVIMETFSVARSAPEAVIASGSDGLHDQGDPSFGSIQERRISLCKGGTKREVTQENKAEYVDLMLKWHTCYSAGALLLAFLQGFHELVPLPVIQASELVPDELLQILCGRPVVDVDFLRAHAVYQSTGTGVGMAFSTTHFLCVWFWTVMAEMDDPDRRSLLRFTTGASSVPVDGLDPPFTITLGEDMAKDALPRAHTCFNQLVIPVYSSYEVMREKVVFAVKNTEGFELS